LTFEASPITFSDLRLSQDSSTQNTPDKPFKNYLDEEQQRLVNLFSPFGQFNFGSMFSYPDLNFNADKLSLFADTPASSYQAAEQPSHPATQQSSSQTEQAITSQIFFSNNQESIAVVDKSLKNAFQELLMQTGWLAPNMEANPAFLNAELKGTLLAKFDMQSLVDKIISQLEMVKDKGRSELRFGLKPENLGEILLTLSSRSGMISINIAASDETRKIMEENLNALSAALKRAKINLENIKVSGIKEAKEHV